MCTLRTGVRVAVCTNPPDYPPQFDLMRYAAMRERVNYAVNERLNIYSRRGVGMAVAKRGSFGCPYRGSIVEFGYGRRTPENSPPFPSRFKLIALERWRLCLNVAQPRGNPGCFLIAPKLIWRIRVLCTRTKADRYKYAYETSMVYEVVERLHGSVDGVIDVIGRKRWPREHSFERVGAKSISSSITTFVSMVAVIKWIMARIGDNLTERSVVIYN